MREDVPEPHRHPTVLELLRRRPACLRLNQFFPTLTAGMLRYHLVFLIFSLDTVLGGVKCPVNDFGHQLECAFECCHSLQGENIGYYCCGAEEKALNVRGVDHRAERFVAGYGTTLQVDYTLLVIGLIVSILVSICLSFLCCLLCNGCWLHKRRNPQQYESVQENGWYPICCGLGIPMGTVVFSTHPPHYRDESDIYHGSSTSTTSLPSSKQRVRFNPDGTPRGVLKNGHDGQGYRD